MTFPIRQRRRQRAIRHILDTLTLESVDAFSDLPTFLMRDLAEDELSMLAGAVLKALPDEFAVAVARWVLDDQDMPSPQIEDRAAETLAAARLWAADAPPLVVKAVAMACYDALPPRTRAGFREWMGRRK